MYGINAKTTSIFLIRGGCAKAHPPPKLRDIHDKLIPEAEAEATLGFTLGAKVSIKQLIRSRSTLLLRTMNQYRVFWRAHLPLGRLVQKYYQLVVNKATSGIHLLTIKDSEFAHLEYMHARCLRRILGIAPAYYSKISHQKVRERAKAKSIRYHIRKKQYALLGHIIRLPEEHPDRLVLFEPGTCLESRVPKLPLTREQCKKQRVGRPRRLWADVLLDPLFRLNTRAQVVALARNRTEWYNTTLRLCSAEENQVPN